MHSKIEFVDCTARAVLDLLKGKFSLEILVQVFKGCDHYGQLLRTIPEINSRILAKRLRQFEAEAVLKRIILDPHPPMSIRYALTPKGITLQKVVVEMVAWHEVYEKA